MPSAQSSWLANIFVILVPPVHSAVLPTGADNRLFSRSPKICRCLFSAALGNSFLPLCRCERDREICYQPLFHRWPVIVNARTEVVLGRINKAIRKFVVLRPARLFTRFASSKVPTVAAARAHTHIDTSTLLYAQSGTSTVRRCPRAIFSHIALCSLARTLRPFITDWQLVGLNSRLPSSPFFPALLLPFNYSLQTPLGTPANVFSKSFLHNLSSPHNDQGRCEFD